jgi:hypothetical protein
LNITDRPCLSTLCMQQTGCCRGEHVCSWTSLQRRLLAIRRSTRRPASSGKGPDRLRRRDRDCQRGWLRRFPTATPKVMRAERTFWEKATAIHVFCAQGEFRGGDRFARHWHDVTRLDAAGFADAAIADKALALRAHWARPNSLLRICRPHTPRRPMCTQITQPEIRPPANKYPAAPLLPRMHSPDST